jgi:predicted glycoside hydrolase/deacetylase ChbG (UPF0249 family)
MITDSALTPMKNLVLCADDFALSAPVSEAIVQLAQAQRISATSAMVLSPRWAQDAASLKDLRGQIDVGLHLDWTSEFAKARGHGLGLGRIMLHSVLPEALGLLNSHAVEVEIERQLDAFESSWQAPPDHIDGHQHVQQFGIIRRALLKVMQRRYAGQQPYLRISRPPDGQADLKGLVMAAWGSQALLREAALRQIPCAPALSGIYNLFDEHLDYATLMDAWLAQVPESTLLMCHPGLPTGQRQSPSGDHAYARVAEWQHVSSDLFMQQLQQHHVRLVRGARVYL